MHAGRGLQHADHAGDLMDAPEFSGRGDVVRALFGARLPARLDELTDTPVI
jgi:hypothetical protein